VFAGGYAVLVYNSVCMLVAMLCYAMLVYAGVYAGGYATFVYASVCMLVAMLVYMLVCVCWWLCYVRLC
jgi:amino acid transporter